MAKRALSRSSSGRYQRSLGRCLPKRARLLGAAVNNSSNSISAAIKCRHAFLSRSTSVAEEPGEEARSCRCRVRGRLLCCGRTHGEHPLFKPRRHGRVFSVCRTSVIKRCCRYHRRALFHSNELKIIHNAGFVGLTGNRRRLLTRDLHADIKVRQGPVVPSEGMALQRSVLAMTL